MFRALGDEDIIDDHKNGDEYKEEENRLYPNLNLEASMRMGASVLLIQDEGFNPIVDEDDDEQVLPVIIPQRSPQFFVNHSNGLQRTPSFGTPINNAFDEVMLTPRGSSNRSSRSNSNVSTGKRALTKISSGFYISSPTDDLLSDLMLPTRCSKTRIERAEWNVGDDDIEIDYERASNVDDDYHAFHQFNEPIHHGQDEEFDLGIASCREEIISWERFRELRLSLAEVPILNRIISFVYYPNLENISNDMKTNDIANMLKSILRLRLVNKKWKQSIDNPTGVLYHYLLEYSSIQKSISLRNLKVNHSEFNFFSIPGIYMVGIGKIIGQTSLIPLEMGTRAYTKMEQEYGSATANTVLALGAGITIASGSFALFMLSGAFYLLPIAAGGFVLDKAINFGLDYSNRLSAEKEIVQSVQEKEKALDSLRMKMRKITKFVSIVIDKCENVEEKVNDPSWTTYLLSFTPMENKHSVNYVIKVTMKIEESNEFTYTIKKRCSHFEKLFQRMCIVRKTDKIVSSSGEILVFPSKEILDSLLGTRSNEIIDTRKERFNKILLELVTNLDIYKDDEEIMTFLTDSVNM